MKLQSKIIIRVYLICAVFLLFLSAIILIIGKQKSEDKVFIFLLFSSISLLCLLGMFLEIKHYVIFKNKSVIIKNRLRSAELLVGDLKKIEIYEPTQEESRYLSVYQNILVFKTYEQTIKFVFYTFRRMDITKELKDICYKNYSSIVVHKKSNRKNQEIYEFIACIIISAVSFLGIIFFSINYSWHIFLSIGLLILGLGLTYHYYLRLKGK